MFISAFKAENFMKIKDEMTFTRIQEKLWFYMKYRRKYLSAERLLTFSICIINLTFTFDMFHLILQVGFGIRGLTRKEIKKLQLKHEMFLNSRNFYNHEMHHVTSHHSIARSMSGPLALRNLATNDSSFLSGDMVRISFH